MKPSILLSLTCLVACSSGEESTTSMESSSGGASTQDVGSSGGRSQTDGEDIPVSTGGSAPVTGGTGGTLSASGGQDGGGGIVHAETCGQSVSELLMEALPDGDLTDERDGQTYRTVTIGTQTWMAENLNIGERVDLEVGQVDDSKIEKYCVHDCDEACEIFGGLYTQPESHALPSRCIEDEDSGCLLDPDFVGICPSGWRLPNGDDWDLLVDTIEMDVGEFYAGGAVRSKEGWLPTDSGTPGHGTDAYGFRALPVGPIGPTGIFEFGRQAWFTYGTRSQYNGTARKLRSAIRNFGLGSVDKVTAMAVRCIKIE